MERRTLKRDFFSPIVISSLLLCTVLHDSTSSCAVHNCTRIQHMSNKKLVEL